MTAEQRYWEERQLSATKPGSGTGFGRYLPPSAPGLRVCSSARSKGSARQLATAPSASRSKRRRQWKRGARQSAVAKECRNSPAHISISGPWSKLAEAQEQLDLLGLGKHQRSRL